MFWFKQVQHQSSDLSLVIFFALYLISYSSWNHENLSHKICMHFLPVWVMLQKWIYFQVWGNFLDMFVQYDNFWKELCLFSLPLEEFTIVSKFSPASTSFLKNIIISETSQFISLLFDEITKQNFLVTVLEVRDLINDRKIPQ